MPEFIDETIDTPEPQTAPVETTDASDASYGALQDRAAGPIDDDPWYSASEGAVVDKDGNAIVDPKSGRPYTSIDEFKKAQEATTATPKKEEPVAQQQPPKPMSRSFESIVSSNGELTPERLFELSKTVDTPYNGELGPTIDPKAAATQQPPVDPVEKAKALRETLRSHLVSPLDKVRDALVAQGADANLVNQLLAPIVQAQAATVETEYQSAYEKALEERMNGKVAPKLAEIDEKKLTTDSEANINSLASKFYPEGGRDAFFALVNGSYDDKGQFVRGPSAEVLDLLVSVANEGKSFANAADSNKAYRDFFLKATANPAKARSIMNVAHYYWLGKNIGKAFEQGKKVASADSQRIQKTVKTRPASFAPPVVSDDEEGMPQMLKALLRNGR